MHGVGQVFVAGAFTHHGGGHQGVNHGGVAGSGGYLHQGTGLGLHRGVFIAQGGNLCLTGAAGLYGEHQVCAILGGLVLVCLVGGDDDHLGVVAVGIGAGHGGGDLIGEGHAVPYAVNALGVQLQYLVVPLDFHEFHFHPQVLCKGGGHVCIEANPVAVSILVVHGGKVGDAHHQGALLLDIIGVGLLGEGGNCQGHHHNQGGEQCSEFFHGTFLLL